MLTPDEELELRADGSYYRDQVARIAEQMAVDRGVSDEEFDRFIQAIWHEAEIAYENKKADLEDLHD